MKPYQAKNLGFTILAFPSKDKQNDTVKECMRMWNDNAPFFDEHIDLFEECKKFYDNEYCTPERIKEFEKKHPGVLQKHLELTYCIEPMIGVRVKVK